MTPLQLQKYSDIKKHYTKDIILNSGTKKPTIKQIEKYNSKVRDAKAIATTFRELKISNSIIVFFYNI